MSLLGVSESRYIETDNGVEILSYCSFISYPLVFLFSRVQVRVGFFTMMIIPVAHIRAHPKSKKIWYHMYNCFSLRMMQPQKRLSTIMEVS